MRYCPNCNNDLTKGYLHLDRVNGQEGYRCGECWLFIKRGQRKVE